jgi:hypothetical protein
MLRHDRIMRHVFNLLRTQLRGHGCEVFTSTMQIKVPAAPPYRYADGSVVCGKVEVERLKSNDVLCNPVLLWEVLSSTQEVSIRDYAPTTSGEGVPIWRTAYSGQ